jgi:hypothetical protein
MQGKCLLRNGQAPMPGGTLQKTQHLIVCPTTLIQTLFFSSGNPIFHNEEVKKRNLRYYVSVFVHRSQT